MDTPELQNNAVTLIKIATKTDTNPGVLGYDANGDPVEIEEGTAGQVLTSGGTAAAPSFQDRDIITKSVTIEDPVTLEDFSIFFTPVAITITEMRAVVRGTTPSVLWFIHHSTDRSAAGNIVVTAGTTTTSESTGDDVTSFNDADIPANSFVWLQTTTMSGTNDELHVTIAYTED